MLKIDIEGSEVNALRGARELFAKKRVENLVVEISPGWWGRNGVQYLEGAAVFRELVDKYGFTPWALDGCGMEAPVCDPKATDALVQGIQRNSKTGARVTRIGDLEAYLKELHTPKTRRSRSGHNVWFRRRDR